MTFRQVFRLWLGRYRASWDHTASLLAAIHNTIPDTKPRGAAYFHPLNKRKAAPDEGVMMAPLSVLGNMLAAAGRR